MLFHLWFHSPDSILYTIGACRGLDHPGDGRAALTGLSDAPVSCQCNARGPKPSHFFRQFCERELLGGKESGFYGGLLCFPHCALLRRGNLGEILLIWEGTEEPKRHQMCGNLTVPGHWSGGSIVLVS